MYMALMVEDSTSRRTPASAAASTTFRVPVTTASTISAWQRHRRRAKIRQGR